jgi:hypothetical protein
MNIHKVMYRRYRLENEQLKKEIDNLAKFRDEIEEFTSSLYEYHGGELSDLDAIKDIYARLQTSIEKENEMYCAILDIEDVCNRITKKTAIVQSDNKGE